MWDGMTRNKSKVTNIEKVKKEFHSDGIENIFKIIVAEKN